MHIQSLTVLRALSARFPADTSISDKVKAALTRIEKEASGLLEIMQKPDPEKSSMAIDRIINDEKGRLRDLIAKSRNEVNPLIAGWRAEQDAARVRKANLKPNEYASETRLVFRGLEYAQKLQFMQNIANENDGAMAASLLDAPAALTGLSRDQAEQFRESFLDKTSKSCAPVANEMQSCVDTFFNSADALAAPDGAAKRTGNQPGVIVQPQH